MILNLMASRAATDTNRVLSEEKKGAQLEQFRSSLAPSYFALFLALSTRPPSSPSHDEPIPLICRGQLTRTIGNRLALISERTSIRASAVDASPMAAKSRCDW